MTTRKTMTMIEDDNKNEKIMITTLEEKYVIVELEASYPCPEMIYFEEPYTTEERANKLLEMAMADYNNNTYYRPGPVLKYYWKKVFDKQIII